MNLLIDTYIKLLKQQKLTFDDIPERYREEVKKVLEETKQIDK